MSRVRAPLVAVALALPWALAALAPAQAQTVNAVQDLTCLGTRAGSNLGCTANDFTTEAALLAADGTPQFCEAGKSFIFNAEVDMKKTGGADRYDIGFFAGQSGNDASMVGGTCSVATFPYAPAPFMNLEPGIAADTCGDWKGAGQLKPTVQNIKVTCAGSSPSSEELAVPYVVSWYQNSNLMCTGPLDVKTDSQSKCSKNVATIGTRVVIIDGVETPVDMIRVGGYVDVTNNTLPAGDAQVFTFNATGHAGSIVGYQSVVGGTATGPLTTSNTANATFSLSHGQTVRVFMSVVAANRTLSITAQPSGQVAHWQGNVAISCAPVRGNPAFTINTSTRQIQAALNTTNSAGACTITNTKRARVSLVKHVTGRLQASDQFTVSVSGAGAASLTSTANAPIGASAVGVATTAAATGDFTNAIHPTFRATPGQVLTLTDAMAGGSASPLTDYDTRLTCTNAFTGPGATTGLPTNAAVSTFDLAPAPDDHITCRFTNTPKAKLTLAKTVVNDHGQTATAAAWTLSATGPVTISGTSGAGAVTNATVPPGTYVLDESGPLGYVLTSLACTGAADTNPSDGLTLQSGEIASCMFTNDDEPVGQSIAKTVELSVDADGSGTVTVGDTLAYVVTVTNTGIGTLTGMQVGDPLLTPASTTCASVAPGATCVLSGTYVVAPADESAGKVTNTASVTSNEIPAAEASNTIETPVALPTPAALSVGKSHAGNFSAGGNGSYTLLVENTGGVAVTGTTTVQDTLATGLGFVSGTGTNWDCGAAGQVVTCTTDDPIPAHGALPAITLVVSVAPGIGASVDNQATVSNPGVNGGVPVPGNVDTAIVVQPDLSTSLKTVSNLGGGSSGDVDAGDVLEYTITLVETAGATATGVQVTDTVQAGLLGATVTLLPPGATDHSAGNLVDVRDITVPANGAVAIRFTVTVGGGLAPGDAIDNVATIDNPGGPGATPAAPTLIHAYSQVEVTGDKLLYLRDDAGSPTSQAMDRDRPDPGTTGGVTLASKGGTVVWTMEPVVPPGRTLELDAGTVVVRLPITTGWDTLDLQMYLYRGPPSPANLIGQSVRHTAFSTANTVIVENIPITLNGSYAPLQPGEYLSLEIINRTSGNGKNATIYAYNGNSAALTFATSTVVRVEDVTLHDAAWPGGATPSPVLPGDTVHVRAVASDPFGGADVGSASLVITDANAVIRAGPVAMTPVETATTTRTFEYAFDVPEDGFLGGWKATVTAFEGEEGTVSHAAVGHFEVLGRVTVDQVWGGGATLGDTVQLQVSGGTAAVDGSSTATDPATPATPATAAAAASTTLTLQQAFTAGDPGGYTITLACRRDVDDVPVATTGTGLSREVVMPLDSSITCTWTDAGTVALTIVKLAVVHSDPLNGTVDPKAIPGALVEYQVIVTNPGGPVDADSVVVRDAVPLRTEFGVADINGAGSGSGPVRFTDGTIPSGMTYTYPADVEFSDDNGATWTYVPSDPDGDGIDPAITDIRINPKGVFAGGGAQFKLSFRVRVK